MSDTTNAHSRQSDLPGETILQFGAGRFLRGFIDRFVHQANEAGQDVGKVVVVQSTPGERAAAINQNSGGFPVLVRGYQDGVVVDRVEPVASISRAIVASEQWDQVLRVGSSNSLRMVVSNSTEAGYVLDDSDLLDSTPPRTMPAKLAAVLWHRFSAGAGPLTILPCELIQNNASRLRELVLAQAQRWQLDQAFQAWAADQCQWLNNLVDCMISGVATDDPAAGGNLLAVQAEPYMLLAIEASGSAPALLDHPAIRYVDDLEPYYLRKVRILNGLHTAMVARFHGTDLATVQAVMADPAGHRWVKDVLFEEILPTIAWRVEGVAAFADATLDRFRNPFLAHKLSDIALNHPQKVQVRLQPTFDEYKRLFGRAPRLLGEAIGRNLTSA